VDLFAGVLPFMHTAEEQSFTRAATRLGITAAAVSKAVARLEEELGARLLTRTSRRVALTPEGEVFLARCREAVAQLTAGRETVASAAKAPKGPLTVTLPFILGRRLVSRLPRFAARYPAVALKLKLTDRMARLAEEGIDVAIRVGEINEEGMVARPLWRTRWVTLAAPAYLARRGTPRRPDELASHGCLKFLSGRGSPRELWFREGGGEPLPLKTPSALEVDQGELLLEAAARGMGVCQVLDFTAHDFMRDAQLVEILAGYAAEGPAVYALCLPGGRALPRVKAFLEFLVEDFARATAEPD
jgi:LysR family transcriptional regulator, regulator for bpeEF and oprC